LGQGVAGELAARAAVCLEQQRLRFLRQPRCCKALKGKNATVCVIYGI
jgi:hypothetical protein